MRERRYAIRRAHAEVEALNLGTMSWKPLAPLVTGRHGTGAILLDGHIYTAAGSASRGGSPEQTSLEIWTSGQ